MDTVGWQCDHLAVLEILLDVPGDPDGVSYLERRVIDCVQTVPRFVKEGNILGGKCFYDLAARGLNVVINLWMGHLQLFAHSRAYVSGKGDYVGKKATVWFLVVRFASRLLYLSKDGTIKGSTLLCYVLFFDNVVNDDPSHIMFIIEIDRQSVFSKLKECVDDCCISP